MISAADLQDIQGIIISGYAHLYHSLYFFIHFDDQRAGKAWLKSVVKDITSADWGSGAGKKKPSPAINLALTYAGMAALGYPEAELNQFSAEFCGGMANPPRSLRLGDTAESAPENWEIGGPKQEVIHALLILQTETDDALNKLGEQYGKGLHLAAPTQRGLLGRPNYENFGYLDGISQPEIDGSPRLAGPPKPGIEVVPTGEFILGYPNSYAMFPPTPTVPAASDPQQLLKTLPLDPPSANPPKDFGRNGTYFVFRKLHQDVAAFRRFVTENAEPGMPKDLLAAKMLGRWPSGAPLVLSPKEDPNLPTATNFFGYHLADRDGLACPAGAHIRRVNPRDDFEHNPAESIGTVQRHRIIRRGVSYGPRLPEDVEQDDGVDRGLLFMCLNSDIRRQFEFIQQTWLDNPKMAGLSDNRDPLIGSGSTTLTIPAAPVRRTVCNVPRFVTVRGGAYFFLPSISALRYLSS